MSPLLAAALLLAEPFPDVLDALRTAGVKPRVNLLLDSSCSMRGGTLDTSCVWFAGAYNGGSTRLNKNEQMRATLIGCLADGDGVLDQWNDQVEFSVHDFRGRRTDFGEDLAAHRAAVAGIPARGGTPLTRVLDSGADYLSAFSEPANTETCTPFFQVMLSDGDPNGGAATFRQDCTPPTESRRVSANRPWEGAEYLYDRHPDVLCNLPGDQTITTFSLGFGAPGTFDPQNLQQVADEGGGEYFYAATVPELVGAFDAIMASVAAKGKGFAQITLAQETYFTENRAFAVGYTPTRRGPWRGNLRRLCVTPPRDPATGAYDTSVETCLFSSPDGDELFTNPGLVDQWTGLGTSAVEIGGAGELLRARLGASPSPPYWSKRNIKTWRPGQDGWVDLDPSEWTDADARVNGCERYALINFLHGYEASADCDTGAPLAVRSWPLGAAINSPPVEVRYDEACEVGATGGRGCFIFLATNDGVVHVFDARTGEETSAIVPGELWRGDASRSRLADLRDQPSVRYRHRYYVDGAMRLQHVDLDGDAVVDDGEAATLYVGLGRGGRAVYALDVSSMADGVVDDEVSVRPVALPSTGTEWARMADTWSAPIEGIMRIGTEDRRIAVLTSGHDPRFDVVDRSEAAAAPTPIRFLDEDALGAVETLPCAGADGFAAANGLSDADCAPYFTPGCSGTPADPCYDGLGVPIADGMSAVGYTDGDRTARALRFRMARFDLGPGDALVLEDGAGREVARYGGGALDGGWTDWVFSPRVGLRLQSDGVDSAHEGYAIDTIEWEVGATADLVSPGREEAPVLGVDHRPMLYVVGAANPGGDPFAASVDDDAILFAVAADCSALGPRCLDASTSPDLAHMRCPVSAEPTPYWRGGRIVAWYFGDECGQIFKVYPTSFASGDWRAVRLASLNAGPLAVSKDHRKVFTRFDLVESICPGEEVVGLYFGTGNVQRPLAEDELADSSVTDGRDVVGVLWDGSRTTGNHTVADFEDATDVDAIDPVGAYGDGKVGWLLRLSDQERMLRDPLVLAGTAFFRTFEPRASATACSAGSGTERFYAVDNCSVQATEGARTRDDRVVLSVESDGGGELLLIGNGEGELMVSHADVSQPRQARLGGKRAERPGLFLWREIE